MLSAPGRWLSSTDQYGHLKNGSKDGIRNRKIVCFFFVRSMVRISMSLQNDNLYYKVKIFKKTIETDRRIDVRVSLSGYEMKLMYCFRYAGCLPTLVWGSSNQ